MRRVPRVSALSIVVAPCIVAGIAVALAAAGAPVASSGPQDEPASATLPFALDHNRMIVDVGFVRRDGTVRTARAWVDTGNPTLLVAENLARDLGLDVSGLKAGDTHHSVDSPSPAPRMLLGGVPLDVDGVKVLVRAGTRVMPGVPAEANLPASALRRGHVVFDYPARRLTFARPGVVRPRGVAIPCRVNAATGLFQIAATVDGETVQVGVDNGSAGTWVSDLLTQAWRARHPEWPSATGAVGSANFFGFRFEASGVLMRLPELGLGPLRVPGVGLLGLDQQFFDWYSQKTAAAVAGFIGANVLKGFRLEVDYPKQMTYWEESAAVVPERFDIVGLTIRPEPDGGFTVAGVATKDGRRTVDGVEPGDALIRVDALETAGAPMGQVVEALRGKPGEKRTLVLERAGVRITAEANVTRLP
jgi:hypothetical protein